MIDFHELQQRDLQAIGQQKQRLQRLVPRHDLRLCRGL